MQDIPELRQKVQSLLDDIVRYTLDVHVSSQLHTTAALLVQGAELINPKGKSSLKAFRILNFVINAIVWPVL